jgi:oligogalacturonide transporter
MLRFNINITVTLEYTHNAGAACMKKLSKFDIGVYASGEIFGGGTAVLLPFFYLIFLTDVMGLNPAAAGSIFLIVRIWDAVSDPLMGYITDNTRTKIGRRRPYFIAGFFGVFASIFLLWNAVGTENQTALYLYVLFANLFYTTVNTMVMVTYIAMGAEISDNSRERDLANGAKMVVSQIASLICALVPLEIVKFFADEAMGYRVMGLVFALFFALPFLLMGTKLKEVIHVEQKKKRLNFKDFTKPFSIRSFRNFVVMFLFTSIAMSIVSTIFAYFMKYYLHRNGELTYVLGTMLIVQTVVIPFVLKVVKRVGKPRAYGIFSLIWVVGAVSIGAVSPSAPVWFVYVAASIIGAGIGGCIVLVYIILPDIALIGEAVTGDKSAGSISGVVSFMRKLAGAIAAYLVTLALQYTGYIKPVKTEVDGIIKNIEQLQPDSFLLALRIMFVFIPIVLALLSFYASTRYKADNVFLAQLQKYLQFARGDSDKKLLTEEEEKELFIHM